MLRQLVRRTPTSSFQSSLARSIHSSPLPCRTSLSRQYQPGLNLIQVNPHRIAPLAHRFQRKLEFHSSAPRKGPLPLLVLLKASTALELARTASRIVLTFLPFIMLGNRRSRYFLKHPEIFGEKATEEKKAKVAASIRQRTLFFHMLLSIPVFLFWATIIASMERTPLTGRWRLIILSPEEEEEIAKQLAGPGWYNAVTDILAQDGPVRLIPTNDWRFLWVRHTLRQLESTIPILMREHELCPQWLASSPQQDRPLPPPAQYPLRPRPRFAEEMRSFCDMLCEGKLSPVPHSIADPPYSLLLVEKPDALNAFSYGFGPDGGGGIVVYTGFLDDILSRIPSDPPPPPSSSSQSWWSQIFGSLFESKSYSHPVPSQAQTTELAILLAHELAHLILSHHLETLSSDTVTIPGTISLISDVLRVIIFPVTMIFGPFVNDAIAQLGKYGTGEFAKIGEYCTSVKQEIEADVVSARLLAHAGYDARDAIGFWEQRAHSECAHTEEVDESPQSDKQLSKGEHFKRAIMGSDHPVNEVRIQHLKSELVRWETERRAALRRAQNGPQESHINLTTA